MPLTLCMHPPVHTHAGPDGTNDGDEVTAKVVGGVVALLLVVAIAGVVMYKKQGRPSTTQAHSFAEMT